MFKIAAAGVGGFILVFIESYLVMMLKGYSTIDFGGIAPFVNVWAMNFFLLFVLFTQIHLWYVRKYGDQDQIRSSTF